MGTETTPDELRGRRIRQLREAASLSTNEVARAMAARGFSWKSRQTVLDSEQARRSVSDDELASLAVILYAPMRWFRMAVKDEAVLTREGVWSKADWNESVGIERLDEERFEAVMNYQTGPFSPARREARRRRLYELAWAQRREEDLKRRTRSYGPTFLAVGRRTRINLKVPGFQYLKLPALELRPDIPYTARDRLERDALLAAESDGRVRRISRFEARKLRTHSSDNGPQEDGR